jgi:glycerol-3-phosphate O-acyltransferase
VPNHRSYFDFLIVSWLFYVNYLVPPHIYARENMAFGPFGFIFRRCGAFFARGKFDDALYKEVFRSYVGYLVREGVTQEFFIEGGRSRTGKTLNPRFGMLSWDVEAFLGSSRRDLFFVPVGLTYERLVEEELIVDEQRGGEKRKESVLRLVRARKFLQRRFGTAHVNFGEPISLADALGDRRPVLANSDPGKGKDEKRHFVEGLGHRIVEQINGATAANSTAVAASVLLGNRETGMRHEVFLARMRDVLGVLRLQDVRLTGALATEDGDFGDSLSFLERSELIRLSVGRRDTVVYFEESSRQALDLYRNSIAHFLVTPSLLARRLQNSPVTREELRDDLRFWQELLYREYFMPRDEILASRFDGLVDYFETRGWLRVSADGKLVVTPLGGDPFASFENQTRGILEVYLSLFDVFFDQPPGLRRKDIFKRAKANFERARVLGDATRLEALNETTLANALDLLLRSDVVVEEPGKGAPRDPAFGKGARWEDLGSLFETLAGALAGR